MVVEEIESLMEMKQLAISHQIRKLTYNPIVTARKVKKYGIFSGFTCIILISYGFRIPKRKF